MGLAQVPARPAPGFTLTRPLRAERGLAAVNVNQYYNRVPDVLA